MEELNKEKVVVLYSKTIFKECPHCGTAQNIKMIYVHLANCIPIDIKKNITNKSMKKEDLKPVGLTEPIMELYYEIDIFKNYKDEKKMFDLFVFIYNHNDFNIKEKEYLLDRIVQLMFDCGMYPYHLELASSYFESKKVECHQHFILLFISNLEIYIPRVVVHLYSISDKLPKIKSFLELNFPIDRENFATYFEECIRNEGPSNLKLKEKCLKISNNIEKIEELMEYTEKQCLWNKTKDELYLNYKNYKRTI